MGTELKHESSDVLLLKIKVSIRIMQVVVVLGFLISLLFLNFLSILASVVYFFILDYALMKAKDLAKLNKRSQ